MQGWGTDIIRNYPKLSFNMEITVRAPINIAVIKYWGKSNEELMLPCNDSISMTLESSKFYTETRIVADPTFKADEFCLNGHPEIGLNKRIRASIKEARRFAGQIEGNEEILKWNLKIYSLNTVPTASGLASSASGIAALSYALIKLYRLDTLFPLSKLSGIARLGSGSACRSLFGGLVHWKGEIVEKISDWPELNGYVLVLNAEKKKIPSTEGMQNTVKTSSLFQYRVERVVPERTVEMLEAIKARNFEEFAQLAMKDSNSFHACCMDTFPPISYLNPESFQVISAVHEFNEEIGRVAIGYTFDAGPNAVIYGLKDDPKMFMEKYPNWTITAINWTLGEGPKIIQNE